MVNLATMMRNAPEGFAEERRYARIEKRIAVRNQRVRLSRVLLPMHLEQALFRGNTDAQGKSIMPRAAMDIKSIPAERP